MNSVEKVKELCKERKIPISKLEKDLGYANGYIGQLRKGVFPSDRLIQIAEYLGVSTDYILIGDGEDSELTTRDRRDIAKDLDRIMTEIQNGDEGPLYYNGEELDEASLMLLNNAIEYALKQAKKENKVKYNPYKNKK